MAKLLFGNLILIQKKTSSNPSKDSSLTWERIQIGISKTLSSMCRVCSSVRPHNSGANYAIAGTRSGDIYFCYVPSDLQPDDEEKALVPTEPRLVYSCHDNEIPKEVDFNSNNRLIFCITERGLFTAWEFSTLRKLYNKHFNKNTVSMKVLKNIDSRVIIAFDTQIIVLDTQTWTKIDDFDTEFHRRITDLKVSKKEDKMAVAFSADQDGNNAYIELFKIDHTINKFTLASKIDNIAARIEFMDFSEDDNYLMYSDSVTQKCFYDLSQSKKNDTLAIEFEMEWVSDGIKLSEKTAELDKYCEEDNNFRCMAKVGESSLVVTDEIGTVAYSHQIRLFEYPARPGKGYYKLYTQHLSYISTCRVAKNQEYLVTASSLDRYQLPNAGASSCGRSTDSRSLKLAPGKQQRLCNGFGS